MTTDAAATSKQAEGAGMALAVLRYLDLPVLVVALPVFLLTGSPLVGYAAVAAAWLLQRGIQVLARRRAVATGDRRAAIGVLAGSMVARLWLLALAVLCAGLVEREAGVAAGVLAAVLFTIFFATLLIVTPLEQARQ